MFCPKCGKENPDDGRFCRKCGRNLSDISVEGPKQFNLEDKVQETIGAAFVIGEKRKKKGTWEAAMGTLFMGVAMTVIAFILAFQPMGQDWWFWLLIPGFLMIGSGCAQIIKIERGVVETEPVISPDTPRPIESQEQSALPPKQTTFVSEESPERYQTGEVVPASVTEGTTRHLEFDPESQTTKLEEDS